MQKKYFFIFLFFNLFIFSINAQNLNETHNFLNIFDGNTKKNEKVDLMFYIDSTKKLNLENILEKNIQQKFKPAKANTYKGFIKYPIWIKLNFKNESEKNRFFLETSLFDDLEFWQKNDQNAWEKIHTGEQKPFYTRPIVHRSLLFSLNSPPNIPQTIYLKCTTVTRVRFQVTIWEKEYFNIQNQKEILFYGFFYGIICLMLVYNFLIWLRVRDIAYLFYVCFAGAMFMTQFTFYGFSYQYLFPNTPFFNGSGIYVWVGLVNIFAGNFCRYFLDLPKKEPFWNSVLFFTSFYGFSVIILSFFLILPNITLYVFICNPLYSLFLVSMGIMFWRKGNRFAPFFAMAWFAYLLGLLISASYNWGYISANFWTGHSLQMSTMAEIVMLSLAMTYKHKILDDEAKQNLLEVEKLRFEQILQKQEKEYLEKSLIQKEKIHQLEHDKMEEILAFKERELTTTTLQVIEKNNLIHDIETKLQKISRGSENNSQDFKKIANILRNNIDIDNDWEKFKLHFEQVHPDFFQKLSEKFPTLSQNDLKILSYIKINMTTKDIARLLNIEYKSLKMTKYRIKKKLNIVETMDLQDFLKNLI